MGSCGKYISDTSENISLEGQGKFNIPIVKDNTVLLSFKLTVGRVAITRGEMLTNEAIAQLPIKNPEVVDTEYLYYYLKNYKYETLGSTSSIATAVNSNYLKNMKLELPDLCTQKKIANILSVIDDKIEKNEQINNNLVA